MKNKLSTIEIEKMIYRIRGHKVLFDADLARLYGVTLKALTLAVKRNPKRFPKGFLFKLTAKELAGLGSGKRTAGSRSGRLGPVMAFTCAGAVMLSNVLNSKCAVMLSIAIIRIGTFIFEDTDNRKFDNINKLSGS